MPAVFLLDGTYTVEFAGNADSKSLALWRGDVTFDFGAGSFRQYALRTTPAGGQLVFSPAADLDAGDDPVAVIAAYLNGDQKQDLVALNASFAKDGSRSGQVVIRLNQAGPVRGDLDGDRDVDIDDFNIFAGCLASPGVTTPPPGATGEQFARADLDGDLDVDLADFADFQALFGRP